MSTHRRRIRRDETNGPTNSPTNSPTNGLNLNGFDLNSILSIANSIDINQLTSIIRSLSQSQGINNDIKDNDVSEEAAKERRQRRSEIANALTTLINADRAELLQVVMQLYGANKTGNR